VILERSLEGFAHQVLESDDLLANRKLLLYRSGFLIIFEKGLQFALTFLDVLEELLVDQQKLGEFNHRVADKSRPTVELLQFYREVLLQFQREIHHGVDVRK
jgi:hypothetical protein